MTDDGDETIDDKIGTGEIGADEIGGDAEPAAHPKFRERRAEVADQSLRSRNRKLVAVGAVVLALVLAAASTQSPLFDVDEVRIIGAEAATPDYLRAVAGIELGEPILGLDTDTAVDRLEALPEIATARATKSWGGIVTIEVNERLPVAWIDSPEGTIVVAADGTVLDVVTTGEDEIIASLPEIQGAMFSTAAGRQVPAVLNDALGVASALPADVVAITDRIEITVDSLVLRVVGGGSIALGDARDLEAKFDTVRAFLAEVDLSCLAMLNVQAPTVPVIVRSPNC